MRAGGAEGDPERDGSRTLVNGWESRLWSLEDKHLREGSSVRQFGRPRPLRIRHRRRRKCFYLLIIQDSLYISNVSFILLSFLISLGDRSSN